MKYLWFALLLLAFSAPLCAQDAPADPDAEHIPAQPPSRPKHDASQAPAPDSTQPPDQDSAPQLQNTPPPRSDVESSSNETKIDTRPPADDAKKHPNSDVDDIIEFHHFDPHKATKDIEVGDFYFKRENYRAAKSRYEEALQFKPNDADATLRLAKTEEKLKKYDDARQDYNAYLKIIPQGKDADEARKALAKMPKADTSTAKQ
ncbi:MAG TPA: tetratricopeptide repeat protein [Candidatus Koribacter sp.]